MDGVPRARLHFRSRVHVLLDEEAGIEAILVRVVEVDRADGEIIVHLTVDSEHLVRFLLQLQELLGGKESRIGTGRVVCIAPWRAVRVTIAIVLMLQELPTSCSARLDFYAQQDSQWSGG